MTKKECKKIAKEIAELEKIIQNTTDAQEKHEAQEKIMKISGKITDLIDMMRIDEMIQSLLDS